MSEGSRKRAGGSPARGKGRNRKAGIVGKFPGLLLPGMVDDGVPSLPGGQGSTELSTVRSLGTRRIPRIMPIIVPSHPRINGIAWEPHRE